MECFNGRGVIRAALSGGEGNRCRNGSTDSCDELPDAATEAEGIPRAVCGV